MDDIEQATAVVLRFVEEMTEWEERMYIFNRLENGKHVPMEEKARVEGESRERLDVRYASTFADHCTVRERKYGGPHSWGRPTKYAGISAATLVDTQRPRPGRIEVTATKAFGAYVFIVLKKQGDWKIDSLKVQYDGEAPAPVVL